MAHSGTSGGPGSERRSSSPFSATARCATAQEAKSSPKSKEKITPFHMSALSDGGIHSKHEGLTSAKFPGSARDLLADTSGSLTAPTFRNRNRTSAGSSKEPVSNPGSVQAAEEQTSPPSQPVGRKAESLTDAPKAEPPSHIRSPQNQKRKLKQGSPVCSDTKPQSAMKKKKRKMGMYNLVPKKKSRGLKQQEKNVEPVAIMRQSGPAADKVRAEILLETLKNGEQKAEKNEVLTEVKPGEGCCIEYTELALDCLDLKAQEELLLPRLSDADVTENDLAEELPLCCCRMETPHSGGSLPTRDQTCMAMESVDGMLNRCHRRVIKQEMMRPSNTVHLLVLCEDHRAGMVKHQCCPGCGLFCRVGTFMECRPYGNISHRFHRDCASMLKGHMFCPHCGEDAFGAKEVTVQKPDRPPSVSPSKPGPSLPAASIIPTLPSAATTPVPQVLRAKKTSEPQRARDESPDRSKGETVNVADRMPKESLESILMALDNENLNLKNVRYPSKQLYISAKQGDIQKVIHLLVDGKDPNFSVEGQNKRTPLHASAAEGHQEICHILVQAGANLDVYDEDQRTPLMVACQNNHLDTVKYLLRAGAAVSCKDLMGFTCLHLSAKLGHFDTVQHLLSKASKYINCQDKGGWTPITWAIEHKHKELVRLLLARGADVNIRDQEENVCLHWAALAGCDDIAQVLLEARCDLNAVNIHGDSSLHVAARENHLECVMLLLSRGADGNQRNNEGQTPLDCSVDGSKVWTLLHTNKKLTDAWRGRDSRGERQLSRDVSRGYEAVPIACVNGVDCEPCPQNFKYIPDNCVTSALNIDKDITHLQHCSCSDDCSSTTCICGQLSQRCWYDSEGRLPLDFCQREPPVLFECNHACSCWRTCRNRVVQNGIKVRLQLFRTQTMGWGVRTMQDIPHGTFVCEYVGEIIPDAEADKRENDSFLFTLDNKVGDAHCIDSRLFGNVGRFINHSCEPNLMAVRVFTMHQDLRFPRIAFFSRKPIKAGDQIGFDYGDNFWNVKRKYFSCQCGSPKCRHSSVST